MPPFEHMMIDFILDQMTEAERAAAYADLERVATVHRTAITLRSGERVTSKDGQYPTTYANRTQAERAAAKIPRADVIHRGRPFYVRLPRNPE